MRGPTSEQVHFKTKSGLKLRTSLVLQPTCVLCFKKQTHSTLFCCQWTSCSFSPAALVDVGKRTEAERHTETHHLWLCDQFTWIFPSCDFVPQSPNSGKSSAIHYRRLFCLKQFSVLLVKQSLRISKMATRNTSSSDTLLDRNPAHLVCDWTAATAPALLFATPRCLSIQTGFTVSCITFAVIGQFGKVKGETDFCFGRKGFWEVKYT